MKHILYVFVGLVLMASGACGIMVFAYATKVIWLMYVDEYFIAVNRTLFVAGLLSVCWVVGREFVNRSRSHQ